MESGYLVFLLTIFTAMFLSVKKNKLTRGGAIAGGAIGCFIFAGAQFTGIAMTGLFFLLGTLATSWKINEKEKLGAAEKNSGRRTASQVIANGGIAGILGILSLSFPGQRGLFQLMMAASLASATADTLSSELGTVYGKNFYIITSFQNGRRGDNGVVSMEGSIFGICGSVLIAIVYAIGFGWSINFLLVVIAGTIGNIADSIIGATLERRRYLKNDAVNMLNTAIAALSALVLEQILKQ